MPLPMDKHEIKRGLVSLATESVSKVVASALDDKRPGAPPNPARPPALALAIDSGRHFLPLSQRFIGMLDTIIVMTMIVS
jgi:hypothetical protein